MTLLPMDDSEDSDVGLGRKLGRGLLELRGFDTPAWLETGKLLPSGGRPPNAPPRFLDAERLLRAMELDKCVGKAVASDMTLARRPATAPSEATLRSMGEEKS